MYPPAMKCGDWTPPSSWENHRTTWWIFHCHVWLPEGTLHDHTLQKLYNILIGTVLLLVFLLELQSFLFFLYYNHMISLYNDHYYSSPYCYYNCYFHCDYFFPSQKVVWWSQLIDDCLVCLAQPRTSWGFCFCFWGLPRRRYPWAGWGVIFFTSPWHHFSFWYELL